MSDYFLVGTKYENQKDHWDDMFPEMVHNGAVAVGYARDFNLAKLYGQTERQIDQFLKAQGENGNSRAALRKFLTIQAGDWIALKGFCAPKGRTPRLLIVGYAIVTPQNGTIYRYSPDRLGHLLNVEFIETDISRELRMGYSRTVHRFSNAAHIRQVFDAYAPSSLPQAPSKRGGTQKKNTSGHRVEITKSYVTRALHNRIQQSLFNHLRKKHGSGYVTMERDFVDIRVEEPGQVSFYEVKPYNSAKQCIREALGQLLEYAWFVHRPNKTRLRLVVVGPNDLYDGEREYLAALQASMTPWTLEYLRWE